MRKLIILAVTVIISFMFISSAKAGSLEKKLYKWVIVTKTKIKKDYSEEVNSKIVNIFIKYRYLKDKKSLNKLEVILKEKIIKINSKKVLSRNDRKLLNLYNNIYYRTKLLLDYNI